MEPIEGIEPSLPRYKLGSLPLQHIGILTKLVLLPRLELGRFANRANGLHYRIGALNLVGAERIELSIYAN